MKVSVKSINHYLSKKLSTDQMVAGLERTEVEVEQILSSNKFDEKIIAAKITAVKKHPNADRLKLVSVDYGQSRHNQIVCGAPNVATNQIVVLAQVGSKLPNGTTIKAAQIRGVESAGMLCSPAELGLSDDHSGLLLLDDSIAPGTILCDIWPEGDQLDIKTQPNRWDQLSLIGLAREASGYTGDFDQSVKIPASPALQYKTIENVNVKKTGECRRFMSVKLAVKNNIVSPQWLVDNLEANGLRSISPVVDITNFVTLETGQPSHAYDFDKVSGQLSVRHGSPAEKLTTLDGASRKLTADDLVIADESGAIGLAGVIGGQTTEVDRSTTKIILEVANFDRELVRKTALRHGLRTEASARFERSLPLSLPPIALPRLIQLFQEICQAEIIDGPFDQLYDWPWVQHIGLRLRRAERVLGMRIDERRVVNGLKRLGFEVEHFSLTKELSKHLGKPYIWGANFKQHGVEAFDCSYLTSYIYSLIGKRIGETAYAQFQSGVMVEEVNLKPGDLVFRSGHWTDKKLQKERSDIGHVGIYMGQNKVIHAAQYEYKNGQVRKMAKPAVIESPLSYFINNPGYKGARRYVESFNHLLAVTTPWWRTDVALEEDLIEEVIKIIGYDKLPTTTPLLPPMATDEHQLLPRILEIKKFLVARGLFEVMTYSFIGEDIIKTTELDTDSHLEILNPLSREQQYLRTSLLPSHLQVVANNQSYRDSFEFFEVSRVYKPNKSGSLPDEQWQLGLTVFGNDSLLRLKGQIDAIAEICQLDFSFDANDIKQFISGRSAIIKLDDKVIGQYGQVRPSLLNELKIVSEISFCEVNIRLILDNNKLAKIDDLLPYSPVVRDIAIEIDNNVFWQDIKRALLKNSFVIKANFLNDFADQKLSATERKSMAFRVVMDVGPQPKSEDISKNLDAIISNLKKLNNLKNLTQR